MKRKLKILFVVLITLLIECKEKSHENRLCSQLENDSLIKLKGKLNISSKGVIVFDNVEFRNGWQRKTHLIPCGQGLKKHIFKSYDSYLNLKNFDEEFWVTVEGKYIKYDTLQDPLMFVFNFVALIEDSEALTDSTKF